MRTIALVMMSFLSCSSALGNQDWLGNPWRLEKVYCPFNCSQSIKNGIAEGRSDKVIFEEEKAVLPKIIGSCLPPAKPDWDSIQPTQIQSYLEKWSDNELANKKPKTKAILADKIGLKSNSKVSAGVVRCSDGTSFNFIFVNAKKALILFEENSYFELSR